jgi:hypothetical protein
VHSDEQTDSGYLKTIEIKLPDRQFFNVDLHRGGKFKMLPANHGHEALATQPYVTVTV